MRCMTPRVPPVFCMIRILAKPKMRSFWVASERSPGNVSSRIIRA